MLNAESTSADCIRIRRLIDYVQISEEYKADTINTINTCAFCLKEGSEAIRGAERLKRMCTERYKLSRRNLHSVRAKVC